MGSATAMKTYATLNSLCNISNAVGMGGGEMTSINIVDYARRETEYHVKNSVDRTPSTTLSDHNPVSYFPQRFREANQEWMSTAFDEGVSHDVKK